MLKFWKNISLLVQIGLIVGIILGLAYFDPWGMFRSKKKTLTNTTISVQSIKEIGQYVSAEYYGEVLTSLQETRLKQVKDNFNIVEGEFDSLKNAFLEAMLELNSAQEELDIKWPRKGRKVQKVFYDNYQNITESPLYQTFISEMSGNKEKAFLKKLVLEEDATGLTSTVNKQFGKIKGQLKEALKKQLEFISADKKLQKSQIVVLARGWVKAGFDFGQFTEDNFSYEEEKGIIHLINVRPEILHCDINPWFMPEEKIKGFEFVLITKRANDPRYVHEVKSYSLVKLRQMALKADILKKAKENAERNLKYFFDLILDKPVNEVVIHDSYLSYFDRSFRSDSLTVWSMQSIDSMMIKHYPTDSFEIVKLRKELANRSVFLAPGVGYPATRFSSQLYRVSDSTFSNGDVQWLVTQRNTTQSALALLDTLKDTDLYTGALPDRLDSIWYYPEKQQVETFKVESDFHEYPTLWQRKVSDTEGAKSKIQQLNTRLARKIYTHMFTQKMKDLLAYEAIVAQQVNTVLKGDTAFMRNEADRKLYDSISSLDKDNHLQTTSMSSTMQAIDQRFTTVNSTNDKTLDELTILSKEVEETWDTMQLHAVALRDTLLKISLVKDEMELGAYPRYYSIRSKEQLQALETVYQEQTKALEQLRNQLKESEILQPEVFEQLNSTMKVEYIWYFPDRKQQDNIRKSSALPASTSFFRPRKKKKLVQQAFKLGVFQFLIEQSRADMEKMQEILGSKKSQEGTQETETVTEDS